MLRINCSVCQAELEHPGALLFGPPKTMKTCLGQEVSDNCSKFHLCCKCYVKAIDFLSLDDPTYRGTTFTYGPTKKFQGEVLHIEGRGHVITVEFPNQRAWPVKDETIIVNGLRARVRDIEHTVNGLGEVGRTIGIVFTYDC